MREVFHKPQEGAQEDFLSTPVTEVFFGGEAGGGKSWGLCQDFLNDVDNPNANGILFRKTFSDLEDLIFKARDHFAGFNPKYNESKHIFIFPSGARFRFAHMNHVKNIFTHAGQEYSHIDWDELCHFPKLPYLYLFSRCRSTDPELDTRIRGTGNPDGIGVLWVKTRFIDKLKPYEVGFFRSIQDRDVRATKEQENELFKIWELPKKERVQILLERKDLNEFVSRQWIPTVRAENKALMQSNPQYEAMLNQLPEKQKRAYKFGVWDTYDAEYQVIKTEWFQTAISGDVDYMEGIAAVGGDYAESGDKCVLCSGRGNQVRKIKEFEGLKTHEFADKLWEEHMYYGKNQTLTGVDGIGPGTGVYHELQKKGLGSRVEPCREVDSSYKKRYEKSAIKLRFNNWRTQAIWKLREDMQAGEVDLHLLQEEGYYYDNLHLLQEEMLIHTYEVDPSTGVVKILSKKDIRKEEFLGRSPDRFDALVMWNWMRSRSASKIRAKLDEKIDYCRYKLKYVTDRTEASAWT